MAPEKHVVAICVTVAALALAAAVLGVVGEATNKSRSYVKYDGVNCVYRRTPAFGCGIAAAAALLTGQVILTAAAGCWDRCRTRSDHRRAGAVCSSTLSWFMAIIAASAFLVGALRNESGERRPKEDDDVGTYYRCTVLVAGVFAGASFFALVAAAVGITSYIALESAKVQRKVEMGMIMPQQHRGCPADCSTCGSISTKTMRELFEDGDA